MDQSVGSRLDIAVTAGGTVAAAMIAAVLWFGLSWTDAFGAIPVWISAAYALFGALLLAAHRPSRAAMLVAAAISLTVSVIVDPILSLRPLLVLTAVVLPVVGATMVREWWRMAALPGSCRRLMCRRNMQCAIWARVSLRRGLSMSRSTAAAG